MQNRKHDLHQVNKPLARCSNGIKRRRRVQSSQGMNKKLTWCASICSFFMLNGCHTQSLAHTHSQTISNVCFTAKIYFKFIVSYLLLCHQLTIFGGYQSSHTHYTKLCTCGWNDGAREWNGQEKTTTTTTNAQTRMWSGEKNDMNKIEIIKKILLVFFVVVVALASSFSCSLKNTLNWSMFIFDGRSHWHVIRSFMRAHAHSHTHTQRERDDMLMMLWYSISN